MILKKEKRGLSVCTAATDVAGICVDEENKALTGEIEPCDRHVRHTHTAVATPVLVSATDTPLR